MAGSSLSTNLINLEPITYRGNGESLAHSLPGSRSQVDGTTDVNDRGAFGSTTYSSGMFLGTNLDRGEGHLDTDGSYMKALKFSASIFSRNLNGSSTESLAPEANNNSLAVVGVNIGQQGAAGYAAGANSEIASEKDFGGALKLEFIKKYSSSQTTLGVEVGKLGNEVSLQANADHTWNLSHKAGQVGRLSYGYTGRVDTNSVAADNNFSFSAMSRGPHRANSFSSFAAKVNYVRNAPANDQGSDKLYLSLIGGYHHNLGKFAGAKVQAFVTAGFGNDADNIMFRRVGEQVEQGLEARTGLLGKGKHYSYMLSAGRLPGTGTGVTANFNVPF